MFESKESLKKTIQYHIDNPMWTKEQVIDVKNIVNKLLPHSSFVTAQSQPSETELERLRGMLIYVLKDYDVIITKNHIVFQSKEKTWWRSNSSWVLGAITVILTGLGLLVKLFYKI